MTLFFVSVFYTLSMFIGCKSEAKEKNNLFNILNTRITHKINIISPNQFLTLLEHRKINYFNRFVHSDEFKSILVINDRKKINSKEEKIWAMAHKFIISKEKLLTKNCLTLIDKKLSEEVDKIFFNPVEYILNLRDSNSTYRKDKLITLAITFLCKVDYKKCKKIIEEIGLTTIKDTSQKDNILYQIGKSMILDLDPHSIAFFKKIKNLSHFQNSELEYAARSALYNKDWKFLHKVINLMDLEHKRKPEWLYWKGQAIYLQDKTKIIETKDIYNSIQGDSFYRILAEEFLSGKELDFNSKENTIKIDEMPLSYPQLTQLRRILQTRIFNGNLKPNFSWDKSIYELSKNKNRDESLIFASEMAKTHNWIEKSISTSEMTGRIINSYQRFPTPYLSMVSGYLKHLPNLKISYVYAILKQESRFSTNALSKSGAMGIMQIMPATGSWLSSKLGLTISKDYLNSLEVNIYLGIAYLDKLMHEFKNSYILSTAAYNAGPNRVKSWLAKSQIHGIDPVIWIELIPFQETKEYVHKVLFNTVRYQAIMKRDVLPIRDLIY